MTTDSATTPTAVPAPDAGTRRAEIALVAAEEFTARGYHETRVEHIAERLGVTPGALYRHVPGKYEIFRDAVFTLVRELDDATSDSPPDLDALVAAVVRPTLLHRRRGTLYRWYHRYLRSEDRRVIRAASARIRGRVAAAVGTARGDDDEVRIPGDGSPADGRASHPLPDELVAAAVLAAVASLGDHRTPTEQSDATEILRRVAHTLVHASSHTPAALDTGPRPAADTPAGPTAAAGDRPAAPRRLRGGAATREAAMDAAIARFHSAGYDDVTMEAIGADVGIAASALYRHFPGKSALLAAAVDRTADLVRAVLAEPTDPEDTAEPADPEDPAEPADPRDSGSPADPRDRLLRLLDRYVHFAFTHAPALLLYHSELGTLAPEDRRRIRRAQRHHVDHWVSLVRELEPGTAELEARVRVRAALAIVLDCGRGLAYDPAAVGPVGSLAAAALLGGAPTPVG